jgi:hypothetical protein
VLVQEEAGIGSEAADTEKRIAREARKKRMEEPDLFPFCFYRKLDRLSAQMRIVGDRGQEHPLDRLLGGERLSQRFSQL